MKSRAQTPTPESSADEHLLMPIGGSYSEIYAGFCEAVFTREITRGISQSIAHILVLPSAYSSNPLSITQAEREVNMHDAEERRIQIEEACTSAAPQGFTCQAFLAPIFTRSEAEDPGVAQYFPDNLTAIFILGGDQTVAMQVIGGTTLESLMQTAYERGVIVAGTSAGGGMQAVNMLGGYNSDYSEGSSLFFGAPDLWAKPNRRGLSFGIEDAIIDQHFYQRSRVGRLLNAIAMPDVPHVGIGIDAHTGVHVVNGEVLEKVFGLYTVTILDAETYHTAEAVRYSGPRNTISLRNVLVHMLSPGPGSYNLATRQHSLGAPPARLERQFETLALPPGAGPLIVGGNLSASLEGSLALNRFVNLAGGENANLLIIAAAYPSGASAQYSAEMYAASLNAPAQVLVIGQDVTQPVQIPAEITGILLLAYDQSRLQPDLFLPVADAWRNGIPLMTDNGASAAIGAYYSSHGPTPEDAAEAEAATQKSFQLGKTDIQPGMALLNLTIEPQIIDNNRWGRIFSLAYNHPALLALGLTDRTAIEITSQGVTILGEGGLFVLDLRNAQHDLGVNQGFVIANGLLDLFAAGERVWPESANQNSAPVRLATPVLPTPTPTPEPTSLPAAPPTSAPDTPAPTAPMLLPTPPESLPPAQFNEPELSFTPNPSDYTPTDPGRLRTMIVMGFVILAIVALGLWLNKDLLK